MQLCWLTSRIFRSAEEQEELIKNQASVVSIHYYPTIESVTIVVVNKEADKEAVVASAQTATVPLARLQDLSRVRYQRSRML
jgi:hypothetical protein